MSSGNEMDIKCACGRNFKAFLWQSVNITLMPDFRKRILGGEMNVVKCPSCGARFHVEIPFLYHDMMSKEWIWVYPLSYEKESAGIHARIEEMWERVRERMSPEFEKAYEDEYSVRVLFGMDALLYYLRSSEGNNGGESNN
jgi:hypothetical protein